MLNNGFIVFFCFSVHVFGSACNRAYVNRCIVIFRLNQTVKFITEELHTSSCVLNESSDGCWYGRPEMGFVGQYI